jgi:hypothetical protein
MLTIEDTTKLKKTFVTRDEHEDSFGYIVKHMATKEDIAKIWGHLETHMTTKEDVTDVYVYMQENMATKRELADLEKKMDTGFNELKNLMDGIAGMLDTMRLENAASAYQYSRQLEWNTKVGEKVGIPFAY